ncbi:hypothetical protein C0J52_21201 [Blattella germanica]|nr:hypothetical protein C0J52_21201 [Blattella germanica]
MLSGMFSFMKKTKRFRHNPESEGIYLSDLNVDELDPEVAALYFPTSYRQGGHSTSITSGGVRDEDAESGNGTSLPQSPHSVEGAIGGPKSLDSDFEEPKHSIFENKSYGEISMSLCGGLTTVNGGISKPSEDSFLQGLVTYNDLVQNPKIIENPDLVVRLNGQYYNWRTACPLIMSLVVYHKPLPQQVIDKYLSDYMPLKGSKKPVNTQEPSRGYSSWFYWRRTSEPKKMAAHNASDISSPESEKLTEVKEVGTPDSQDEGVSMSGLSESDKKDESPKVPVKEVPMSIPIHSNEPAVPTQTAYPSPPEYLDIQKELLLRAPDSQEDGSDEKRQVKRRRVNVTPGKSISVLDVQSSSHTNIPAQPKADTSTLKKPGRKFVAAETETSDERDVSVIYAESNDSWGEESESEVQHPSEIPSFREEDKVIGSHVIVTYEGKYYPGIITGISKNGTLINVMEQTGKHWRWPAEKDEILYRNKEIVCKINAPMQHGKRSIYDVPEISQLILLVKEEGYSGSNSSDDSDGGRTKSQPVKLPIQRRSYYEHTEKYRKTLRLSSDQIASLNLNEGANEVVFSVTTAYQGTTRCKCHIYKWRYDDKVVISDIDGTITKSDVLGHILPIVGKDWAQSGVAQLFTKIKNNGYRLLYLSARAIGQARVTREYLKSIKQGDLSLPDGPLLLNPTSLISAFHREVIEKKPEEFKISCLRDIQALFPSNSKPFYAGYGNKINVHVMIEPHFTKSSIQNDAQDLPFYKFKDVTHYSNMSYIVDQMFPPPPEDTSEDFSNFVYWRDPIPDLIVDEHLNLAEISAVAEDARKKPTSLAAVA